jgi:hypothetical protein
LVSLVATCPRRRRADPSGVKTEHLGHPNNMSNKIAILDDEPERIREMLGCLNGCISDCEIISFDNAPDMIAWFAEHLQDVQLICLDHDLGPNRQRGGEVFDPGTGRDVADYLATRTPVCPVLVHTTNSLAAPGMAMVLDDSGWKNARVVPYNDLLWISEAWIFEVREALRGERGERQRCQPGI